jgi:pseudouridine-5'-phosphate glycosidase
LRKERFGRTLEKLEQVEKPQFKMCSELFAEFSSRTSMLRMIHSVRAAEVLDSSDERRE